MDTMAIVTIVIAATVFLTLMIILFTVLFKLAKKNAWFSYEMDGFRRSTIAFKVLNISIYHQLLARPGKEYVLTYKLETTSGEIGIRVDDQFEIKTDSRIEDSIIIVFNRWKPIVVHTGQGAKAGRSSVRIKRKRW